MAVVDRELRAKAALETVRSVLVALILVALLGSIASVVAYRADVREARNQVRERVANQGRLYADSMGLHFDVLRSELQRLADRGLSSLDSTVLEAIREDRTLFGGGVMLLDLEGKVVWSVPTLELGPEVRVRPWFQHVLLYETATVDELLGDDSSRLAVALPVKEAGALAGVLVGLVGANDRLVFGVERPGEQLLLLSSNERVVLPLAEPTWSHAMDFDARVEALRAQNLGASWTLEGHQVMAEAFPVKNTGLQVLALESEETAITPIRHRLEAQLAFLLVVQAGALGAFVLFLRRTWRAFLEAEKRIAAQEKMAALGTASSLIAHEVKNSLNGLKAASSLLTAGGDAALATRTIEGQVNRLGYLARSLLSFARPTELKRVTVHLDSLVRSTVQSLEALPEWPEAQLTIDAPLPLTLESDPLLLTTAIDNLVRNAIEAAVGAKDLGKVGQPAVLVRVRAERGCAVVRVEDNAGGASAELESRLGEPFFTTKPRGIGLGLAMTQRAVEQLGGRLRFERSKEGSVFELELPLKTGAT
ncbi:MAG: sensor histidine kinase [Archangium sp.]|nr:sensor histidine kinase [Archangium sp.]